jgi:hypothetical protein
MTRLGCLALLLALAPATPLLAAGALPAGPPSVVVQSLTGNVYTTTSISVRLVLTWPTGAEQVTVTNGDGAFQTFPVADTVEWQLAPLPPKTPAQDKAVTVTYTGPGIADVTLNDTILLDDQAPRLPDQRLFQNGKGWFLAARAEDAGAGVAAIALLGSTGQPIKGTVVCGAPLCPDTAPEAFFLKRARPRVARLTDAAGNTKAVQLVRRATRCSLTDQRFPVFTLAQGYYDCVQGGDRCRPDDGHFWNRSAYVRCLKTDGRYRVVVVAKDA